jgi:hypothetical protein
MRVSVSFSGYPTCLKEVRAFLESALERLKPCDWSTVCLVHSSILEAWIWVKTQHYITL